MAILSSVAILGGGLVLRTVRRWWAGHWVWLCSGLEINALRHHMIDSLQLGPVVVWEVDGAGAGRRLP